jgi:hypothetical protein
VCLGWPERLRLTENDACIGSTSTVFLGETAAIANRQGGAGSLPRLTDQNGIPQTRIVTQVWVISPTVVDYAPISRITRDKSLAQRTINTWHGCCYLQA